MLGSGWQEGVVIQICQGVRPQEQEVLASCQGESLEEVTELVYFGTVLCKSGSMEGEVRERAVNEKQVIGTLRINEKSEHRSKEAFTT